MKQTIITVIIIAIGIIVFWLVEPLFGDNIVNEELVVSVADRENEDLQDNDTQSSVSEETTTFEQDTDFSGREEPVNNQQPLVILQGSFKDGDATHTTTGNVYISGQDLSLANFRATNVPDGYVYLSNSLSADNFVSIGKLKGNVGNQNYKIPDSIDVADYKYVLIWCKAFSVLIGSAVIK